MVSRFLGINLAQGVRRRHLLAYLYAVIVSSGYAGALSVLQPGLLHVIGIPTDEQALLTGNLSAMQEVVFILTLGLFGALSDRLGRRTIYVFGLAVTALGYLLYPSAESVSDLVVYRLVIAIGSAAMVGMMVTVIADYSQNNTRGKANGVQGLMATFGAFIPPLLGALPAGLVESGSSELQAQQTTFSIAAALGASGALVALLGLAPKATQVASDVRESIAKMMREGAKAAKDPNIALSYGAAFISRGDLAVTGAFIGLWFVQHGTQQLGLQPSEAMAQLAVPAVLTIVTGALAGSILMGVIADKVSRVTAVSIAAGLASATYLGVYLISDPSDKWVLALLLTMGIAEISAFVSSQALVGENAKAERRGAIIGFFGIAGAFGILVGTSFGGYLFGKFGPSTPFVLFGFLNLLVFIWSLVLRKRLQRRGGNTLSSESLVTTE